MYLKRITINGFKSFADKVTISFDHGNITGVVGPNGSGKSNVIDAVRWVMGEQNTKLLRGERATDIIFAGSQKRQAIGMAEVSLTFDNSKPLETCPAQYLHDPEITVSRRMYADNNREAYINRRPVRLRDITEFFSSAGISGRSYSMIQQGQVDRILQAKPEEIRDIVEEAAGTAVFKRRREETLKKLAFTQQNLSRIEDLVREIQEQLATLKQQADKAREWESLTSQLQEKELDLLAFNANFCKEKLATLTVEIEKISKQEQDLRAELAAAQTAKTNLSQELAEADPDLLDLSQRITVLRESQIKLTSSLQGGEETLAALQEQKFYRRR